MTARAALAIALAACGTPARERPDAGQPDASVDASVMPDPHVRATFPCES